MSRHGRKWLLGAALTAMLAAGLLILSLQSGKRADQIRILQVGDEMVYANEAMVYWHLLCNEFEGMATEEIWDLQILGLDPKQTAMDRVLESIVRIKAIQPLVSSLKEGEAEALQAQVERLQRELGQAYMDKHQIDEALLRQILEENYKAYRYEKEAKFLAGSNEEQIAQRQREAFAVYEVLDRQQYLQTAAVRFLMMYTGQWADGEWISYSDAQKELILQEAEELHAQLTPETFGQMVKEREEAEQENPVFSQGAVQHKKGEYGYLYYGQIDPEAAEIIFQTSLGEITPVIETEYGYLIVQVISYCTPTPTDEMEYEKQLESAKEAYRMQLMEELKHERLEEEWQRLEEETLIRRWDEKWTAYIVKTERN
ncbi:MAG: hypothetical protein HFE64_09995 [Lachnospiraceae bacterium]|jgi:hypothetical protein|nr:hypothetical protein [Lachnospiraceae bacterium]